MEAEELGSLDSKSTVLTRTPASGQFHEYKGDQRPKVTSRPHQAKHTFAHVNKCIVYVNTCTVYMQKLNIANVLFVSPVKLPQRYYSQKPV